MQARAKPESEDKLGFSVQTLEPEVAARLGYDEAEKGVLVTGIQGDSKAEKAGVQEGDLIKEVNRTPISNRSIFAKNWTK